MVTMEVWHVRHGERCDKLPRDHAEGKAWRRLVSRKKKHWRDPPLTQLGHAQASRVGSYLGSLSFNQAPDRNRSGFDRVYTSPLMRAVQTAACISRACGGLPLQVVPGLCSCTATIRRIGLAKVALMSDADVVSKFPDIDLLPRDLTAPTSFRGTANWLAKRPSGRVLCVGHREGIVQMAGRVIPTPYCCVGIFRVDSETTRYELADLKSYVGTKIKLLQGSTSAMKLVDKTKNVLGNYGPDHDSLDAVTNGMTALTISADGKLNRGSAHTSQLVPEPLVGSNSCLVQRRSTPTKRLAGRHSQCHDKVSLMEEIRGLGLPGFRAGEVGVDLSNFERRASPKADCVDPSTRNDSSESCVTGGARLASAAGSLKPSQERSKVDIVTTCRGHAARRVGGHRKPSMTRKDSVGRVYRVAELARRPSVGFTSLALLRIPQDALCGSSGVLSFLQPLELCVVQATCKAMATAATDNALWSEIIRRLPQHLRKGHAPSSIQYAEQQTKNEIAFKRIFVGIVSAALSARADHIEKKHKALRSRLGTIRGWRGLVDTFRPTLTVSLSGTPVAIVDSRRPRSRAWTHRRNILSEPSVFGGLRIFTISSSIKVEISESLVDISRLRSMDVACSFPEDWLPRAFIFHCDGLLLSRARLVGKSADNAVTLYDVVQGSGERGSRTSETVLHPAPRACVLFGVLEGGHNVGRDETGGVGFLTVNCPHELLFRSATHPLPARRPDGRIRSQSYGDDSAGARYGLENFTFALGLRTSGVPMWETTRKDVDGCLCGYWAGSQSERAQETGRKTLVRFDLLRPGDKDHDHIFATLDAERRLCGGPGLPYCTSSGLSGVVENVLIADFIAIDTHGSTIWTFVSPVIFRNASAMVLEGICAEDGLVDMTHREVREERRRGVVHEAGVGKVVVELALVELDDETSESQRSAGRQQRCPAGHSWAVRSALVELELGFVNAWFGTKHGHPLS